MMGVNSIVFYFSHEQHVEINISIVKSNTNTFENARRVGAPIHSTNANDQDNDQADTTQQKKDVGIIPRSITPQHTINTNASSPYAYVWIIGAIHEDKPSYKGFVWDVLVSASLLRKTGSTADFWLYVRLSPESKLDTMPDEDLRLLDALGVKVRHLDKPKHESFSQLMYDKFYILNMTEYKRVMFLDADTIPLTNLDYYFHLSDPGYKDLPTLLKPFFLFATRGEPTNGGMFIAEPSAHIYEQYKEAVRKQHEKAKTFPYPHFDRKEGWGHSFLDNGDEWEAINKTGKRWHWHGSHVDQGIMYYVAKYLCKEVSISIGQKVQNWKGVDGQINPEKESESLGMLEKYQPELLAYQYECDHGGHGGFEWTCNPPYDSFAHFVGPQKPWQGQFSMKWINEPVSTSTRKAAMMVWFKELITLNDKHSMGIDFEHWNDKHLPLMKESSLGYMPMYSDQANVIDNASNEGTFASEK
jgi:hypothetical protein